MSQRRDETLPSTEMTSMIDIIFQLLIFFLVTLALGSVQEKASAEIKGEMQEDLPQLPPVEKLSDPTAFTDGFLLQVIEDKEDDVDGKFALWILDPLYPSVLEAKADSSGTHGPYSLKRGFRTIRKRVEDKILLGEAPPPLSIRAHEETPYGYILEIMSFCNQDSIETVDFRFARVREGSL